MGDKALQHAEDVAANGGQGGTSAQKSARWLRRMAGSPPLARDEPERDRSTSSSGPAEPSRSPSPPPRPTVHMTYSVILDLDLAKKSDRAERVLCHYDRSHNSHAAYHIELTWLAGSGKIIDNTIQSWARQVARWGLNLVEVSTRPVDSNHNPFQRATQVPLALPPPPLTDASLHRQCVLCLAHY
jgi:hypothetical protein